MTVMLFSFTHERPHYMRMAELSVTKRRRFVKAKQQNLYNTYNYAVTDLTSIANKMENALSCILGRRLV